MVMVAKPVTAATILGEVRLRGYATSPTRILRERRAFRAGTEIVLISDKDESAVCVDEDDLIAGAAVTLVDDPNFDVASATDKDDTTYAHVTVTIPAWGVYTLAVWDLATVANRYLVFRVQGTDSTANILVDVSEDCATFTNVVNVTGASADGAWFGSFRCVRLRARCNSSTDCAPDTRFRYYSIEAYEPPVRKAIAFDADEYKMLTVFAHGHYALYEVVRW